MKYCLLLLALLFFSSCGSLKVSPQGCRSTGLWGDIPEEGKGNEKKITGEYYVWNVDYEVKLRDLLKTAGMDCRDVKKIRMEIKSVFFVKRELTVFVSK